LSRVGGNSLGENPPSADWMEGRVLVFGLQLAESGDAPAVEDGGDRDCSDGKETR
jgi:hypothetical protein